MATPDYADGHMEHGTSMWLAYFIHDNNQCQKHKKIFIKIKQANTIYKTNPWIGFKLMKCCIIIACRPYNRV